jgi:flagellar assembly protein FliH
MSSSKIIKPADLAEQVVCSFDYGQLGDGVAAADGETDEFIPLQIREFPKGGAAADKPDRTSPAAVPPEPAGTVISDDELQAQLTGAYTRGMEEGRRQAERGLSNVFKALRDGVAGLTGLREKVLRDSEDDLLQLTIMVARKVIQQELAQEPRILANVINAALASLGEQDRVAIRLNPADYTVVNANRQVYLAGVGEETALVLSPDEAIEPGGCMVDTATGTVDARIEVQLDEVYRQLLEQRSLPHEPQEVLLIAEDDQYEPQG